MGEHSSLQLVERVIKTLESDQEIPKIVADDLSKFLLDGGYNLAIDAIGVLGINVKGLSSGEVLDEYLGLLALGKINKNYLPFFYKLKREMAKVDTLLVIERPQIYN